MSQDVEHLRLLSVFHYVVAGLTAVFSCFPLMYVGMGIAAAVGAMPPSSGSTAPPAVVGGLLMAIGIVGFVFVLAMATLIAYAGKCLADKKHYTFCIVIAAISCLSFPFGTALGVFTIVVLQRPGVRVMFGQRITPQT